MAIEAQGFVPRHPSAAVTSWFALLASAVFVILMSASCEAGASIDAAAIYHDYCSVCHGDHGDGRSHAQQGLIPPPRDFTTPRAAVELSTERMLRSVRDGVPGTAMTAWKDRLSEAEMRAVVKLIETKFMPSAATEEAGAGRRIYAEYCSVCHGDTGTGALWAVSGLAPPPVDFTDPAIRQSMTRERMIQSVAYGRAETAMTGWSRNLSPAEIEGVVDYVRQAFMAQGAAVGATNQASSPPSALPPMTDPMPQALLGDVRRGERIYLANCVACHGAIGDGRGPRAYFINPKPRNFVHTESRAKLNRPALYQAIAKGSLGAEMPAWEKVLEPQGVADVAEYVFVTFIRGEPARK